MIVYDANPCHNRDKVRSLRIPNKTFEFLAWLVRQDVTLPSVITDYLKWDEYSKEQIKAHFLALNNACIDSRECKSKRRKTRLSVSVLRACKEDKAKY
jgi:hypothetical protein